ncbi:hypothetical protein ABXT64_05365 [Candidatus Marifrigoribacter sp. Uisw_064]|jgi:hypothetical protein|uniref:hypothetical protein n=1 Tax=Candidatus Marifrigoribacter sp. Uisw_064 TaxID=3230970 RepID=UPI003D4F641D
MKRILSSLSILILLNSCINKSYDEALNSGLEKYPRIRNLNLSLVEGYTVEKLAFFKTKEHEYKFVLKLSDATTDTLVERYSLGLFGFVDKKYLKENKNHLSWNSKPVIESFGKYKYIIKDIVIPTKEMDSIIYFLYDRDKYRKVIGHRIVLKNIQLR